ncbi:MAG TPA: hypothetical protein VK489_04245 [Ferruginibacter sp.]|nr:hypothetical protein [Ferruginibacter sp.]
MIRLNAFLTIVFFIASCTKPTGIKEVVLGADSVAVSFFKGDGSIDPVVKVTILRERKDLEKLSGYMESGRTQNFKCGYDGSLHFFKKDIVLKEVDFRMNDADCMHFSFLLEGKLYNTSLSAEAKQFLGSINKK